MTKTSAISMMPALMACTSSPMPGTRTTTVTPASLAISTSSWPTPTVSMRTPRELFAIERMQLKPLPAWIPEVYRLHQRTVDVEGYVALNSLRYSVPFAWIGRSVEVRETRDKVEIELDRKSV